MWGRGAEGLCERGWTERVGVEEEFGEECCAGLIMIFPLLIEWMGLVLAGYGHGPCATDHDICIRYLKRSSGDI